MNIFKTLLFQTLFITGIVISSLAQKNMDSRFIDKIILKIPDSLTTNTDDISDYINTIFLSEPEKIRAIYVWITNNIEYDIENMYDFEQTKDSIVIKTLKLRKGTCLNYTCLFNELALKSGIQSYLVNGYTKKDRVVSCEPHSWCATKIDSSWYIFDPTWGAGIIQYSEFVKEINFSYFKMQSKRAIKTHMPFDHLWQFLYYPVSHREFSNNSVKTKSGKSYFNYIDTLLLYNEQTVSERLSSAVNRIENSEINNYLTYNALKQYKIEIENIFYNTIVSKYDSAKYIYKEGVFSLNRFIDFRNNKFKPDKSDLYIKQKIDSVENLFTSAKLLLECINSSSSKTNLIVKQLYKSIEGANILVKEQKKFVKIYINTPKNYRKSLFYDKM